MSLLQRKDFYLIGFLYLVVILIFFPLFYTEYVFTDEAIQLWNYRPGSGFNMFAIQGRWLTEQLIGRTFDAANSISDITYIRIFALAMWLVLIPVWYIVMKRVTANGAGYEYLPLFTCLYLVTSLPFSISIQWASCLELPIANTAALVSGAILYIAIRDTDKWLQVPVGAALGAIVAGFISLSAYQSGFACFLIPFLFHYISAYTTRKDKVLIKGLAFCFFMYAFYFLVFKIYLAINHIPGDARTGISFNVIHKLAFFIARPLKQAFSFNVIVNIDNNLSRIVCVLLFGGWVLLAFNRFGKKNRLAAVKYLAAASLVFLVSYTPSLLVKENYSSNRTLFAIDMCVWVVCAEMVLYVLKKETLRKVAGYGIAIFLVICGWYNFNKQFLMPIREEYNDIRNYVFQHYNSNITTVYFIQPGEDAFQKKYHLQSSMDEFGVPSTFFTWVPEPFIKLLVLEKTGSRETAGNLTIKWWNSEESFKASGEQVTGNTLIVNVPQILSVGK
jgi:hypothetical protein